MIGGAVSASSAAVSFVNDLSASVQAQLNVLRQGSATAQNAVNANFALSASDALALGGVLAANIARRDVGNTLSGTQVIVHTDPAMVQDANTQAAQNRKWIQYTSGLIHNFAAENDALTDGHRWLRVTRSATFVELIEFSASAMTFAGINVNNPLQMNSVLAAAYARLDNPQTFNKGTGSQIVQMTDGGTITPNCDDGNAFRVVLGGNRTMAAPNAARSGQTIVLHIIQDGTGSRTLTWNSIYHFAGSTDPTLSTAANAVDVFAFNHDSVSAVWRQAGFNVG